MREIFRLNLHGEWEPILAYNLRVSHMIKFVDDGKPVVTDDGKSLFIVTKEPEPYEDGSGNPNWIFETLPL